MTLKRKKDRQLDILAMLLLLLFAVFLGMQAELAIFSRGISGTDSSVFRYVAYLMKRGYMPYRDTFDHKGPILYLINYWGMMIHPVRGVWLFEVSALFGGVLFSYKTARLFASRKAALLSVITAYVLLADCFKGGNVTQEYSVPFVAFSLFLFIKYADSYKIKKIEILACGACFAVVCLLQVNLIAVWIVGIVTVLFCNIYNKQWRELSEEIILFFGGILIIAIPVSTWLIYNRAFLQFWDNYILFNFSYSSSTNLRERLDCYQFFLAQPLVYLAIAGIGYEIYLLKYGYRMLRIPKRVMVVIVGTFGITFPFICMSGMPYIHYEIMLIPVLVMPFCCFYMELLDVKPKGEKLSGATYFLLFAFISALVMPSMIKIWNHALDENRYLSKREEEKRLVEVQNAVTLYSDENDTISVFGNKDIIYLLCNRMSASKYSFQFPIITIRREIYQEYLADLEKNKPKVIIIDVGSEEYEDIFKKWLRDNMYQAVDEEKTIFIREQ